MSRPKELDFWSCGQEKMIYFSPSSVVGCCAKHEDGSHAPYVEAMARAAISTSTNSRLPSERTSLPSGAETFPRHVVNAPPGNYTTVPTTRRICWTTSLSAITPPAIPTATIA